MVYHSVLGICIGCGRHAERVVSTATHGNLSLCWRCPSPDEIEKLTAEIRERWSEEEHFARRYDCTLEEAAKWLRAWAPREPRVEFVSQPGGLLREYED